ncbi:Zn-dependent metalloprotease [Hamadaea flava]|uniref:M4 family metallopeptidase n=1 Tax=Hamadaea flava TaxID=1742688 RepID=A0ABV8LNI1_9ACTN|nr:M4 family metallopeptidase [Hamadaea flava]MCP2329624.1 Zn-dependent metalloprotease [Hamadaea flava]
MTSRIRRSALAASAILTVCGVLTAFTVPADASLDRSNTPAALLANKAAFLHASAHDRFTQRSATTSGGLTFRAYDRTYKGLKVVGGDFVLATDRNDRVVIDSVAQRAGIGELSTTPQLGKERAEAIAKAQLTSVNSTEGTQLVVDALGDQARLAWETTVTGIGAEGFSSLTVQVDALTGAVLDRQEHVHYGTGTSAWNGTVPLDTTHSGSTYSMAAPGTANLSCQDSATNITFSGPDDLFGNGDPTDRETGCVDALYGAEGEMRMLSQWLGRSGMDGSGGAVPVRVGYQAINAFYQDGIQIQIGHNTAGQWIGDIDVVAHELGHGVDYHTGSAGSTIGTSEFVADAFGAATEAFVLGRTDYLVGGAVNLKGTGLPIRNMYNPSLVNNDPNCYTGKLYEEHKWAGVGNHWFYLLAEGSNPTNGQPVSPTCDGSTVPTGVGIQNAIKILYTAMLLKNSKSSYLTYRAGTLKAAKALDPTCALYNATKAAWNAVTVPVQKSEPSC